MNNQTTTLSKGEKIALSAGKEITTPAQFAVCYLVAKGQENKMRNIGMSDNYGAEAGMKPETYRRAVNKFGLLIKGQDEDEDETDKEAIYPKIRSAYNDFSNMTTDQVIILAKETFTDELKELGYNYQFQADAKKNKYSTEAKARKSKTETNLMSEYNTLMRYYVQQKNVPSDQAKKKIIRLFVTKHGKSEIELKKLFK